MANNKINFKHFLGSLDKWDRKIQDGVWKDSIVFGRIYTEGKWLYKIYAGKIDDGDRSLYEYNFLTPDDFSEYEKKLSAIETTLAVNENNIFTDEDFNTALKNTINLLFKKNDKDLEGRLEAVEDAVLWVIPEDIEE